ncbi:MAG: PAS domain S-box protein [Desulfatitalea sp.]|nr:PAS domain S-box protein [Desulfatitalea sp.]NNK02028.1 PAS domain S-box protein [Desulfatitalea sp.]
MSQEYPLAGKQPNTSPDKNADKDTQDHPRGFCRRRRRMSEGDGDESGFCCNMFDYTGTATLLIDSNMTITKANVKALQLFGYSREELLSGTVPFFDYLTPEFRDIGRLYHELLFDGELETPTSLECRLVDKGGHIREVLAEIGWIPESRKAIVSVIDLTEKKATERERFHLNEIVEQSSMSILLTDLHGEIIYINKAFESLSGYNAAEMVGQSVAHPFFSEKDRLIFKRMSFSTYSEKDSGNKTRNRRKDGSTLFTLTRIAPVRNAKGYVVNLVCTKRDITRETELEQQLYQSQKMEAIGTLASGIAHDFNNILAGIQGYSEMAAMLHGNDDRMKKYMDRILHACRRAKDLNHQILTFSRQTESENQPVQIQVLVNEALKLLRASIPATIDIRTSLPAKKALVLADPTRLHQIVLNLCANAAQAMLVEGGVMEVYLENVAAPPDLPATGNDDPPKHFVRLIVKDSGVGIDEQSRLHIFEPYYTTKAADGGTGLGLSVVQNIVKNMGGMIRVESKPGDGSTFEVYLPCTDEPEAEQRPPEDIVTHGQERLLVVDDEAFLLDIMQDMLSSLGYHVETAEGGKYALKRLRKDPQRYDMIIADLTMPLMSGKQLAAEVSRIRADLPILMCTGTASTLDGLHAEHPNILGLLHKPIRYEDLSRMVREVLDQTKGKV